MSKILALGDLKVGMQVRVSGLLGIYDTYLLIDGLSDVNSDEVGTLIYIGKTLKRETNEMVKKGAVMLYFDREEFYEE